MLNGYFVFNELISISDLGVWEKIAGNFDKIIGYSFLGDFFLINTNTQQCAVLYTMPPELADLKFYGRESFVNEFLSHDVVKKNILQLDKIDEIEKLIGVLEAGEVYIPAPYPFMGGDCSIDSYVKGDVWIFMDIIGQLQLAE